VLSPLPSLLPILSCPDDGGALRQQGESLHCESCARHFPVLAPNLVELLPSVEAGPCDGSPYANSYFTERTQPFRFRHDAVAWGAPEHRPGAWVERKHRQVEAVRSLLRDGAGPRELVCDLSAGAGYYTFAYAPEWRHVVHCDLSADALAYAHRKAARVGLHNILFVRMDYFRPPFRGTLERVVCLDSLIRGEAHEKLLLRSIQQALRPGGAAVVDFHNWWHNPIRRLGLLRNNFGENRSYAGSEVRRLLEEAGVVAPEYVPFHQETARHPLLRRILQRLLPPTRHVFRFGGEGAHAAP
jgi:SAM-dependent methyltransferase